MSAPAPPCLVDAPDRFALDQREDVRWVQKVIGRTLTLPEMALVVCVCAFTCQCGPYNALRADQWRSRLRPIAGTTGARITLDRGAATLDGSGLTDLVLAAHGLGVRGSISPSGGNRLELQVHLRFRSGSLFARHPKLKAVCERWNHSINRPTMLEVSDAE